MDIIVILLIALVVIAVIGALFAFARTRQRSGSVLAAPEARQQKGSS
ncbi:MAG: hypothetical protein HKN44_04725 [Ilumatobacter sp.]|nr:hypothetical protein [Ilumatobacter sp.]